MTDSAPSLGTILDLDARHDELLRQLDDLDKRVAQVLAQWQPKKPAEGTPLAQGAT